MAGSDTRDALGEQIDAGRKLLAALFVVQKRARRRRLTNRFYALFLIACMTFLVFVVAGGRDVRIDPITAILFIFLTFALLFLFYQSVRFCSFLSRELESVAGRIKTLSEAIAAASIYAGRPGGASPTGSRVGR